MNPYDEIDYDCVQTIIYDQIYWQAIVVFTNGTYMIAKPPCPDDFYDFQDAVRKQFKKRKKKKSNE